MLARVDTVLQAQGMNGWMDGSCCGVLIGLVWGALASCGRGASVQSERGLVLRLWHNMHASKKSLAPHNSKTRANTHRVTHYKLERQHPTTDALPCRRSPPRRSRASVALHAPPPSLLAHQPAAPPPRTRGTASSTRTRTRQAAVRARACAPAGRARGRARRAAPKKKHKPCPQNTESRRTTDVCPSEAPTRATTNPPPP